MTGIVETIGNDGRGKKGIVHWDKKREAFELLLNKVGQGPMAVVLAIWKAKDTNCNTIANMWSKKWGEHNPKGKVAFKFFDDLLLELKMYGLNSSRLFNCTFDEFYSFVPREKQALLAGLRPQQATVVDEGMVEASLLTTIRVHKRRMSPRDVTEKLRSSDVVEQKYCYLSPDSADRWYGFINTPGYQQFEECKEALEVFLKSALWQEFVASDQFGGSVMLGGGSPTKDTMVMKSMIGAGAAHGHRRRTLTIIDMSPFMVFETMLALEDQFKGQTTRIKVEPLVADFSDLSGTAKIIRPNEKQAIAWFILGGTLGNLREEDFFRSIKTQAQVGDLLIVGVECLEAIDDDTRAQLLGKYSPDILHPFFDVPLRVAVSDKEVDRHAQGVIKNIHVEIVSGRQRDISDVRGTHSVVAFADVGSKTKRILKSTRYCATELSRYADTFKLAFVEEAQSVSNENYKLLVFRKTDE